MARRRFLPALRIDQGLERKDLLIGNRYGLQPSSITTYGHMDRAAGWDIDQVVSEGYERVVWVFKAIEVIAGNASRLPFKIVGDETEVTNHPLLRAMNKQANPMEKGRTFRKRLSAQLLLSKKGAFVEVVKNRRGQITRLDLLPPDRVRVIPDTETGEYVAYYEFTRYNGKVRDLAPEKVRWIREPHPLDPFSGITPLEAAGMSVDLDRLARLYNVSFIKNDGRPGGILGVDADGLEDDELDRITAKMKPGAQHAGEITAIGTGPGGLNYVDTSAKPRDMAYGETSEKSKKEILAAFGVPESLAGDASGRTWDNASEEKLTFWNETMLPHLELIASAFDGDVDDDLDCVFDTSKIEALELPARRRREEKRTEWREGLISIKEYRDTAGHADIDNAHTRALWINPSKAPIPADPADKAELGLEAEGGAGGDPAAGGPPVAQTAAEVVAEASGGVPPVAGEGTTMPGGGADDGTPSGDAQAALESAHAEATEAGTGVPGPAWDALSSARGGLEGKALDPSEPGGVNTYDPGEEESRRVELAVSAALDAMLARQVGVVAARMESPKARRGTRYWTPDGDADERVGDAPIDTERAVDPARWSAEMQETLRPIVTPAAQESAAGLLTTIAATGAITAGLVAGAQIAGRTQEAAQESAEAIAQAAKRAGVAPALLAMAIAQGAFEEWMQDRIVALDALMVEQSPALPQLIEAVKQEWEDHSRSLTSSLAVTVAQTAVGGGRDAAVETLAPVVPAPPGGMGYDPTMPSSYVERFWRTREDESVRATHEEANGQVRQVGEPFEVGGYPVRFPSDPLAPPSVARNCRCWLRYQWPQDARFRLAEAA